MFKKWFVAFVFWLTETVTLKTCERAKINQKPEIGALSAINMAAAYQKTFPTKTESYDRWFQISLAFAKEFLTELETDLIYSVNFKNPGKIKAYLESKKQ